MVWLKRIFLFMMVNVLVVMTLSFLTSIFGIGRYITAYGIDYSALAVFCLVWGMGGAFISLLISKQMVKWSMGVKIVDPNTYEPELQNLVQMVHRLARAAGLPKMPEVGIYDAPDVNAFATGPSRSNSLVAVSTGLLRSMNREEVEGVIGHEISHVANGDMVTLTLLQGVLNAFVMFLARIISFAIANALRNRDDREDRGMSPFVHMFVVMFLEMVLGLLAAMVVAAFSRYREYRADAGSARLAGREKMISALRALQSRYERDMQFLQQGGNQPDSIKAFNISSRSGGLVALLASHPPLADRIRRLELAR